MAIPLSLLAGVSTLFGIGSAFQRGQNRIAELQQQEALLNQQATFARQIGQLEIAIFDDRAKFLRGRIPAAAAKSGVRAFEGSAFEALLAQARTDAAERAQVQTGRELEALGFQQQAGAAGFSKKIARRQLPLDIIGSGFSFGAPFISMSAVGPRSQ
jgi:hypothetical protein